MIKLDEDALICDFAETYQIYDYRSLPVRLAATLAAGLRGDSRIMLRAADLTVPQETILLACIADRIEAFRYGFSQDAAKHINKPQPLVETLMGEKQTEKSEVVSFRSGQALEEALARIRGE